MIIKNAQKKKEIEDILVKYMTKISVLKKSRDSIIINFLEALRKKRIDEIMQSIKQI